ncbi:bacteriohemerythrin [Lacisediminimonas sp.]|uniref:bacteriohemerythrin n=1 Tax=Lacisediminimonas sp. TaxID=3060582 RepID=UPI00271BACB4|nr:hemerythrin family protein [Lacisediminimonas sp.]MDO8300260.1 hemerythrin family protein [Lacisediminimonas sp.]
MPYWSEQLSVGIPEMDASHISMLSSLEHLGQTGDDNFPLAYERLVAEVERDFADEEAMMESIDFPALQSHREQHARVLSGLHHALPRIQSGDIALGREVIELLPQWFSFHISTMDTALAVAALSCGWKGEAAG